MEGGLERMEFRVHTIISYTFVSWGQQMLTRVSEGIFEGRGGGKIFFFFTFYVSLFD